MQKLAPTPNRTALASTRTLALIALLAATPLAAVLMAEPAAAQVGSTYSVNNVSVTEGSAATVTFTITRSLAGACVGGCSLTVQTADGTATAGLDYVAIPPTVVTFSSPTGTTVTVAVTINNDSTTETAETFSLLLSNPTGGATISTPSGTGTINDNDFASGEFYTLTGTGYSAFHDPTLWLDNAGGPLDPGDSDPFTSNDQRARTSSSGLSLRLALSNLPPLTGAVVTSVVVSLEQRITGYSNDLWTLRAYMDSAATTPLGTTTAGGSTADAVRTWDITGLQAWTPALLDSLEIRATTTMQGPGVDGEWGIDEFKVIAGVNQAPTATDGSASTAEDTSIVGGLLTGSDPDAQESLAFSVVANGGLGTATVTDAATGTYTYVPNANVNGVDTFTFQVTDGHLTSPVRTQTITVSAVNDAPVNTRPASVATAEDTAFDFAGANLVSVSDLEAGATPVQVELVSTNGAMTLSGTAGLDFVCSGACTGDGADDTTMRFQGSMASINAALAGMDFVPTANYNGGATLTITTNDLGSSGSGGAKQDVDAVAITVSSVNDPPTITDIADPAAVNEDSAAITSPPFTIGDTETAAASLGVSGSSSNTALISNANITFSGGAASRTVTVTPTPNRFGSAVITVTVTDAGSATASDTFLVTVNAVNDVPTISDIANPAAIPEDGSTSALAFTLTDVETPLASLQVNGTSSNIAVIPNDNIVFGGSGGSRTVTVSPAPNQFGSSTITVTVTDQEGATAQDTFTVTVTSVNDNPTITAIADLSTNEDTATAPIPFTVGDVESAASSLTMSVVSSSSTSVIPVSNVVFGACPCTGARNVTVTPAPNAFGSSTITVRVTDGNGGTRDEAFTVTVVSVNDNPTMGDITNPAAVNEDTGAIGPLGFTVGDTETAVGSLVPSGSSGNTALVPNASIVFGGSGASRTVTVTPAANQFGSAVITVVVTDANGGTVADTFTVTVNNVNDAPVATNGVLGIDEDEVGSSSLSGLIADVDDTSFTYTLLDGGSFGITDLNPVTGNYTYTPEPEFHGTDVISFRANDGDVNSNVAQVTVTVGDVNDPPVLVAPLAVSLDEDTTYDFTGGSTVSASDSDAGAATVQVELAVTAGGMSLSGTAGLDFSCGGNCTGDGTNDATMRFQGNLSSINAALAGMDFVPPADFDGAVTLNITVDDLGNSGGAPQNDTASVAITVNALNDAPVLTAPASAATDEDTDFSFQGASVVSVADDAGAMPIRVTLNVTNGTLTLAFVGNLTFTTGDGTADAQMVFEATVAAANIALNGMSYVPPAQFFGSANVTVEVSDLGNTGAGAVEGDNATIPITVGSVNDAPTTADATDSLDEDGSLAFSLGHFPFADNDTGDALGAVRIATLPGAGSLTLNGSAVAAGDDIDPADIAGGLLAFTPVADGNGIPYANFTFRVRDAALFSAPATMTLDVNPLPDAPTSANATVTLLEDSSRIFVPADFPFADADAGDLLGAVQVLSLPALGSLELDGVAVAPNDVVAAADIAASKLVYTPLANGTGPAYAQFGFRVRDASTFSDPWALTLAVTDVNDAPSLDAVDTADTIAEGGSHAQTVVASDVDSANPAGEVLAFSIKAGAGPSNGVAAIHAATGALNYTPATEFAGTDTFTVQVCDDGSPMLCDEAAITITVTDVNDAPSITTIAASPTILEGGSHAQTVVASDVDSANPAGEVLAFSIKAGAGPSNGVAAIHAATGALNYTPATEFAGTDTFTVQVCDDGSPALCDEEAVTVNVTNVEDTPTITAIADLSTNEDTATGAIAFTVGDVETPAAALAMSVVSSSSPAVVPLAGVAFGGSGASRTVTVTPAANQFGSSTVTVRVTDGSGAFANEAFVVTVTPVADTPTTANRTVTVGEDLAYTFGVADFTFTDADPGDSLGAVRIVSLPALGTLKLNGVAVSASQVVPVGNVTAGHLVYRPAPNTSGVAYAAFTFQVRDAALFSASKTVTVNVLSDGDADEDGVPDLSDNCPTTPNPIQVDSDGDGAGDACDATAPATGGGGGPGPSPTPAPTDSDGDGRPNATDNCPQAANADQANSDGDALGNACDTNPDDGPTGDADGDGRANNVDNCPQAANANQANNDGDTLGDACDANDEDGPDGDSDGDGVRNADDPCAGPCALGAAQAPARVEAILGADGDVGITWTPGDLSGVDGYFVIRESDPIVVGSVAVAAGRTSYTFTDDGYPGGMHRYHVQASADLSETAVLNPVLSRSSNLILARAPASAPDSDGDGLSDAQEEAFGTSPLKADTDRDGVDDRLEIRRGGDPLAGKAVASGGGMPAWVWVAVALAGVALLGLGVYVILRLGRRPAPAGDGLEEAPQEAAEGQPEEWPEEPVGAPDVLPPDAMPRRS